MATTQEILAAAGKLGELIATHDVARRFESALAKLQKDVEAQRALNDFNRLANRLAEKEMNHQPIEPAEKRQLEALQNGVIRSLVLQDFQMAQMDYLDLMRRVDEAMTGQVGEPAVAAASPAPGKPAAPSPIIGL